MFSFLLEPLKLVGRFLVVKMKIYVVLSGSFSSCMSRKEKEQEETKGCFL
jgi:hypothetical protein